MGVMRPQASDCQHHEKQERQERRVPGASEGAQPCAPCPQPLAPDCESGFVLFEAAWHMVLGFGGPGTQVPLPFWTSGRGCPASERHLLQRRVKKQGQGGAPPEGAPGGQEACSGQRWVCPWAPCPAVSLKGLE